MNDSNQAALKLTLNNSIEEVPQLAPFIDRVAEEAGIDFATSMSLNLAVEEAVVNVMQYAYPAGTQGTLDIEAFFNAEELRLVISDAGTPFDPTTKSEADVTSDVENRSIGGLGIHLIRQIMDSVSYERVNGKNVLTLRKKIVQ